MWYVIGDVFVPFKDLREVAEKVGLHEKYVPRVTDAKAHARGAWEKAISKVLKSVRTIKPTAKQDEYALQTEGVTAVMKIHQSKISGSEPNLERMLVLEVTKALTSDDDSQSSAKKKLAVLRTHQLRFNTDDKRWTHVTLPQTTKDEIWINGNVGAVVDEIEKAIDKFYTCADPMQIRRGLYDWLDDKAAFNARSLNPATGDVAGSGGGGGGVYFIPEDEDGSVADDLEALQDYILALGKWLPGKAVTKINIVPVNFEGDRFAGRRKEELATEALVTMQQQADAIAKRLANVRGGKTKGQTADKTTLAARVDLLALKVRIAKWQKALGMEVSLTETVLDIAEKAIEDAEKMAAKSQKGAE